MTPEEEIEELKTMLAAERKAREEAEISLRSFSSSSGSSSSGRRGSTTSSPGMGPLQLSGWRETRTKTITVRGCVVCGREDQPGEQRAKGFKCNGCIGLPTNPHFVKCFEAAQKLIKGKTENGDYVANEYTMVGNLGAGAFGKVRLARHEETDMLYAVKCLTKSALTESMPNRYRRRADPMKPVFDEINRMKELSHPNIIQIYGHMVSDQEVMIVMEHMPNGQIFTPGEPPVKTTTLKRYVVAVASGLDYLHDQGIIHRDIKPQNILLDKNGNVKLADFGVSAKIPEESESMRVWGCIGTPPYIPPEAFKSACMDGEPADIWAFGVTMYQMGFGVLPWDSSSELSTAIRGQEIVLDHENQDFNGLLREMLVREPSTRITCQDILRHEFVREVRVRKGHPVEPMTLDLTYDSEEKCIRIQDNGDGGKLHRFFESSAGPFTLVMGGDYEATLIDQNRDPRLIRAKPANSGLGRARRSSGPLLVQDWNEAELDDYIRANSPVPSNQEPVCC
eukprot:TRINITY_DN21468_c0_g1_i1.p1 TRINITY_DN21468_c0_g1~~TRINITY_DN21468_c0_g1_i1.p1  ORF type:complete len:531 (+),score=95.07 TRINITY_DN21468_c0_g1_i1:70-1593(+)